MVRETDPCRLVRQVVRLGQYKTRGVQVPSRQTLSGL
jgi:hypothetical protein